MTMIVCEEIEFSDFVVHFSLYPYFVSIYIYIFVALCMAETLEFFFFAFYFVHKVEKEMGQLSQYV